MSCNVLSLLFHRNIRQKSCNIANRRKCRIGQIKLDATLNKLVEVQGKISRDVNLSLSDFNAVNDVYEWFMQRQEFGRVKKDRNIYKNSPHSRAE